MPQPIDIWLARQLRAQNDAILRERLPDELLQLIARPQTGMGRGAEGHGPAQ